MAPFMLHAQSDRARELVRQANETLLRRAMAERPVLLDVRADTLLFDVAWAGPEERAWFRGAVADLQRLVTSRRIAPPADDPFLGILELEINCTARADRCLVGRADNDSLLARQRRLVFRITCGRTEPSCEVDDIIEELIRTMRRGNGNRPAQPPSADGLSPDFTKRRISWAFPEKEVGSRSGVALTATTATLS